MDRSVRNANGRAAIVATVLALGLASPSAASEIVLLGDSWGALIGPSVRSTLDAGGYAGLTLQNGSVGGSRASQWAAGTAFGFASDYVSADTRLVHLIVGGNDLIGGDLPPTIISNTLTILQDLVTMTSVPVLFSGYEYVPNPPAGVTAAQANAVLDAYVDGVASAVLASSVLSSQVTVLNTHGLMQVHFGVPQHGIPAFDPSLPDATLPGPSTAFADSIHLTRAGYDVLAQQFFDDFYAPVLAVPEPSTAVLLGLGLVVLGVIPPRFSFVRREVEH